MSSAPRPTDLTVHDVMRDLEAGRSLPLRPADQLVSLQALRRPPAGGRSFVATYLAARVLGGLHPRLARRALLRLWFTPWVHPSALRPVDDVPDGVVPWALEVDGRTLHGYAGGSGPTVVLVHGWAGRAADWRHLAGGLVAAGFRIVAPDLPAHGLTAGRRTDLFEIRDALAAVLGRERPIAVVAHSMGFPATMLAIEAGAEAPPTIVAVAPGRRMSRGLDTFVDRMRLRPALAAELRRRIEARFGPDIWEILDVDRALPDLASVGLVIHDTDDEDVPVDDGREIAARWPGARFVATGGLGHRRVLRDATVRDLVLDAVRASASARGA